MAYKTLLLGEFVNRSEIKAAVIIQHGWAFTLQLSQLYKSVDGFFLELSYSTGVDTSRVDWTESETDCIRENYAHFEQLTDVQRVESIFLQYM